MPTFEKHCEECRGTLGEDFADGGIDIIAQDKAGNEQVFRATGSVLKFAGFTAVYMEGSDENADDDERALKLPQGTLDGDQRFIMDRCAFFFCRDTITRDYLKAQGVKAPVERPADGFDPGAKYHVPGQTPYARYFLARILQFQFYEAACKQAGWKGPLHRCSFYGNKQVGEKLDRKSVV